MKCPGQDSRYWDEEAVFETKCQNCGGVLEFFKDDSTRKCGGCGQTMMNPRMDFGCAAYCAYAEQCLGSLPPELAVKKQELLKDRVAIEVKRYFGDDFKRIRHAAKVAEYAERIGRHESCNLAVVLVAALLHGIGIREAGNKLESVTPEDQRPAGELLVRDILGGLGAEEELVNEVCDIIGHHHAPRDEETVNFKVLYDAHLLVNLEEQCREDSSKAGTELAGLLDQSFLTVSGRELARDILPVG